MDLSGVIARKIWEQKLFCAAALPHLHSPLELILRRHKNGGRAQYRDQLQTTLQRKPNNAVLHKWKRKERQDIPWSKESTASRICIFFDKSKNTQEIQGQWLGYLSQQQGAWELFWTKIKIWPSQSNWVSKAFFQYFGAILGRAQEFISLHKVLWAINFVILTLPCCCWNKQHRTIKFYSSVKTQQ